MVSVHTLRRPAHRSLVASPVLEGHLPFIKSQLRGLYQCSSNALAEQQVPRELASRAVGWNTYGTSWVCFGAHSLKVHVIPPPTVAHRCCVAVVSHAQHATPLTLTPAAQLCALPRG